jgi:hypothetical protein
MLRHFARLARQACAIGVVALLTACGGGGGGGGNSISISPRSLTFNAIQGSGTGAQTVTVRFKGAGVLVGYAPDVTPASWLYAYSGAATADTVQFTFAVDPYMPGGTHSTSVRFVTGNADGSDLKYVDMPVTLHVSDFTVGPTSFELSAIDGSTAEPAPANERSIMIAGTDLRWAAATDQSWIALDARSGNGPASLGFTLPGAAGLGLGTHVAHITVSEQNSGRQAVVTVTLVKRSPRLKVVPDPVAFVIDAQSTAADLALDLSVTDELDGGDVARAVDWTLAAPSVSWLQASGLSGDSASGSVLQLSLPVAGLRALANGTHSTTLDFTYTAADGTPGELHVPVTLDLALPRVTRVTPYVGIAGSADPVILRGMALTGTATGQVLFGDQASGTVEVVSDTELRVTPPALAAGRYPVSVANALGTPFTDAELVVIEPGPLTAASLVSANIKSRLHYDAERAILYVSDRVDDQVERYQHTAGSGWSALDPLTLPGLTDFALTPDGRKLIVTTETTVRSVDLAVEPLAAQTLHTSSDTFCGRYFALVNIANNNEALVHPKYANCSGYTSYFALNLDTLATRGLGSIYNASAATSADGRRIVMGGNGLSPAPSMSSFNASTGGVQSLGVSANVGALAVTRDAGRMLVNTSVYEGAVLKGQLASCSDSCANATMSPDGTRAYRYRVTAGSARYVDVFDLGVTLAADERFPVIASIAVADDPIGAGGGGVIYHVSPDGRTLFLAGGARILALPLPAP